MLCECSFIVGMGKASPFIRRDLGMAQQLAKAAVLKVDVLVLDVINVKNSGRALEHLTRQIGVKQSGHRFDRWVKRKFFRTHQPCPVGLWRQFALDKRDVFPATARTAPQHLDYNLGWVAGQAQRGSARAITTSYLQSVLLWHAVAILSSGSDAAAMRADNRCGLHEVFANTLVQAPHGDHRLNARC